MISLGQSAAALKSIWSTPQNVYAVWLGLRDSHFKLTKHHIQPCNYWICSKLLLVLYLWLTMGLLFNFLSSTLRKTIMSQTNDSKTPPSNNYLFAINNSANITYCPTILLKNIQNHPCAVDSIAEIFVTKLSYYKRNDGVEHKFLVAQIEDSGHSNFIKIDHCLPEAPANPPGLPKEAHLPGSSVQDGSIVR